MAAVVGGTRECVCLQEKERRDLLHYDVSFYVFFVMHSAFVFECVHAQVCVCVCVRLKLGEGGCLAGHI